MTIVEYKEQPVIPMGQYHALIAEVKEEPEGQFGPQFQYSFEITSGEHVGTSLLGWSSQKFSKKSKMKKWATAALERSFSPGEMVDTNDLVGKPVQIGVISDTKDDGAAFNKIQSVSPPSVTTKKAAQSAEATKNSQVDEPLEADEVLF